MRLVKSIAGWPRPISLANLSFGGLNSFMATVGQCKACGHRVSDEAATCPECGQPRPCLLPPAVGSTHDARIESYSPSAQDIEYISVTIPSGYFGVLRVPFGWMRGKNVGDNVSVIVTEVDGWTGTVQFSPRE